MLAHVLTEHAFEDTRARARVRIFNDIEQSCNCYSYLLKLPQGVYQIRLISPRSCQAHSLVCLVYLGQRDKDRAQRDTFVLCLRCVFKRYICFVSEVCVPYHANAGVIGIQLDFSWAGTCWTSWQGRRGDTTCNGLKRGACAREKGRGKIRGRERRVTHDVPLPVVVEGAVAVVPRAVNMLAKD